ncbi:MAG: hypothetical protein AABZ32_10310 [Bacteroidota bacterium]
MGRAILNISIPSETKKAVERRARKSKKTVSAYVLHALQLEQSLIQESEILASVKQVESDYKAGKTKVLRSLADLME